MHITSATWLSPAAQRSGWWGSERDVPSLTLAGWITLGLLLVVASVRLPSPRVPDCAVTWWAHVAPARYVFTASNLHRLAAQVAGLESGAFESITAGRNSPAEDVVASVWKERAVHRLYYLREFEPGRYVVIGRFTFMKPRHPCVPGLRRPDDRWGYYVPGRASAVP